jgi:ATP-dependent Clp protease ATP-binding subunit ClpC
MFERFDETARRAVVRGQEEARRFNHRYVGTEHLLLGVLDVDSGVGRRALIALGVSPDDVRRDVEEIIGRDPEPPSGHIPFTPPGSTLALVEGPRCAVRLPGWNWTCRPMRPR